MTNNKRRFFTNSSTFDLDLMIDNSRKAARNRQNEIKKSK